MNANAGHRKFVFKGLQIFLAYPHMFHVPIFGEPMLCVSDVARVIGASESELFKRLSRKRRITPGLLKDPASIPSTTLYMHYAPLSAVVGALRRMKTPAAAELQQSLELHIWDHS